MTRLEEVKAAPQLFIVFFVVLTVADVRCQYLLVICILATECPLFSLRHLTFFLYHASRFALIALRFCCNVLCQSFLNQVAISS
jgi:hypothetical protein